jgi:hypothetical protein
MRIELHYGKGRLPIEIPEANIQVFHRPKPAPEEGRTPGTNSQKILLEAVQEFGILRLSPIFAGRQADVIIEGAKHTTLQAEMLGIMLPFLRGARFVQFLIASGSHDPDTEGITAGIQKVDELTSFALPTADFMIVSPGGYPEDENLYTALRALELTKHAIKSGGEVLFLAACENGIGPQRSFEDMLAQPIPKILQSIEANYRLHSHHAHRLAQRMQQLAAIHVHSSLPSGMMERIHLVPCTDPQSVVNNWLARNPNAKINVFDDANRLAIYAM